MLKHTRRRALVLLLAACAGARLLGSGQRAFAQDEEEEDSEEPSEPECYESKKFGPWTAQASDTSAGASQRDLSPIDPKACDLGLEFQVNTDFDAKIFVQGSAEGSLPEEFLVKPENRLIAKNADGTVVVVDALCGNCTDIYDDQVSIVLPLATAPLLRDEKSMELVLKLSGKDDDCRFNIDCVTMRQALDWAAERRDALAEKQENNECTSPEGCFITTACCDVLGLDDDCFELRTLRRYRDDVLAKQPGGAALIARYYALAPRILAQLRAASDNPARALLSVYARFVLPAALAARLGLNALAYRLYVRMLNELAGTGMATGARAEAPAPATNT
ncbi:MAG: CFI-box-CTERM domain-containing protein [Methyloceanibacter sp.]|uniref:CFI-box-CTERM domain-containing protein n=1 Tax=Methyloceanibacter sp. TaxID=1965321 RepID=UPI003EE22A3A